MESLAFSCLREKLKELREKKSYFPLSLGFIKSTNLINDFTLQRQTLKYTSFAYKKTQNRIQKEKVCMFILIASCDLFSSVII